MSNASRSYAYTENVWLPWRCCVPKSRKKIRPIPHAQLRPHCNVQWLFEPHKMSQTVLSLVAVPCRNRLQLYLSPQCAHGISIFIGF